MVLVGVVTGAQMLYYGGVRKQAMRFNRDGDPIDPERLLPAGVIFLVVGILAVTVIAVEVLSGAAGTNITAFLIATIVVPPAVLLINARRQRT